MPPGGGMPSIDATRGAIEFGIGEISLQHGTVIVPMTDLPIADREGNFRAFDDSVHMIERVRTRDVEPRKQAQDQ
jgi:hypothetical protein